MDLKVETKNKATSAAGVSKTQETQGVWKELDLSSHYAGLALSTPIIVASSPLAASAKQIVELADSGAGAVVMRSLFEEDANLVSENSLQDQSVDKHTEAYDYIREMSKMVEPDEYMDILADARRQTDIPIIASLNGNDLAWWQDYTYGLERAGASAIELNLGMLQLNPDWTYKDEERYEKKLLKALSDTCNGLRIPLTLKVAPHMANALPQLCRVARSGVRGMVYFNRYYLPDIDLKTLEFTSGPKTSSPVEFHIPLRYLALHLPAIRHAAQRNGSDCDLVLSGGIHHSEQMIKSLIMGASAVQVCSALIQNGVAHIGVLLDGLADWMKQQKIFSLTQLRGMYQLKDDPNFLEKFQRLQYVKTLR